MVTIAVFPNTGKQNAAAVLARLVAFFRDAHVRLLLPMDAALHFGHGQYGVENIEEHALDFAISIGGDGTLLGVCHRLYGRNVPVCGINLGTFGFLPDIEPEEIEEKLAMLLAGKFRIEQRMILAGAVRSKGKVRFLGHALNDVVVTKGSVVRMLQIGLSVNGFHLLDYKADGMIVATSTGSTAYSLSAGGPIINPRVRALVLTPICPHTFNIRPMVLSEEDKVGIHVAAVHQDIIVTFDGQEIFQLSPGDEVLVYRAEEAAKIVKFKDKEYYRAILKKLWR